MPTSLPKLRLLRIERLECRHLLAFGDLLHTLDDPSTAGQVGAQFGQAVAADGDLLAVGVPHAVVQGFAFAGRVLVFDSTTGTRLATLTKPVAAYGDNFGTSVAISAGIAVVGVPFDDLDATDAGAAYVFDAATGELLHVLANPTPADNDCFGRSVAISGNTIVVGAYQDDTGATDAGAAYVFRADTGALLRTVANPSPGVGDNFGRAVAVSGNVMAVGTPGDDGPATDVGRVYVFDSGTGVPGPTLANPTPGPQEDFGSSVAISGDTVAVGAWRDSVVPWQAGAAYVFSAASGGLLKTLANPAPAAQDWFGWSVAVSASTVIVGAYNKDLGANCAGAAYVYDAATGDLQQTLANPTPADFDWFGCAVGTSGGKALVGAFGDDTAASNAGAAYVLDAASGGLLHTLLDTEPNSNDLFGLSVGISSTRVVVGAQGNVEAAYLFDAAAGNLVRTLPKPSTLSQSFGHSVAASESTVVVGSPSLYVSGAHGAGGAALYDPATGNLRRALVNPAPVLNDSFGNSVAVHDDTVVVGAYVDDAGAEDAGTVYVLDPVTGNLRTLANPSPAVQDVFGFSVAIAGDTVVVGTPNEDAGATNAGTVYVFDTAGNLLRMIANPTPAENDFFGYRVAISGNTIVVGAPSDDTVDTDAGAAYVFDAATGIRRSTLLNPAAGARDYLGYSVAIDGNTVVVGAPGRDAGGIDAGAAYAFDAPSGTLLGALDNPRPDEGAGLVIGDLFGFSVSVAAGIAVVGAPYEDGIAVDRGAAYLFDVDRIARIEGTQGNDVIRIVLDAGHASANVFVNQPGPTPSYSVALAPITQWNVTGGTGDDELTVDFSNGSPLPVGGLVYDGGPADQGDRLRILGAGPGESVQVTTAGISVNGSGPIVYGQTRFVSFDLGTGPDNLIVDGVTLTLDLPNHYAGGMTVKSGTLTVGHHAALPDLGDLTIEAGATVVLAVGLNEGAVAKSESLPPNVVAVAAVGREDQAGLTPQCLFQILPSPFGRGAGGEGLGSVDCGVSRVSDPDCPHPDPLPKGEGTGWLPKGEGTGLGAFETESGRSCRASGERPSPSPSRAPADMTWLLAIEQLTGRKTKHARSLPTALLSPYLS